MIIKLVFSLKEDSFFMDKESSISAIDLFCGIGGLSFRLKKHGLTLMQVMDLSKR
jgi:hypothetical protein